MKSISEYLINEYIYIKNALTHNRVWGVNTERDKVKFSDIRERLVAPPDQINPVKMVQASCKDVFWGNFSRMLRWEKTPG